MGCRMESQGHYHAGQRAGTQHRHSGVNVLLYGSMPVSSMQFMIDGRLSLCQARQQGGKQVCDLVDCFVRSHSARAQVQRHCVIHLQLCTHKHIMHLGGFALAMFESYACRSTHLYGLNLMSKVLFACQTASHPRNSTRPTTKKPLPQDICCGR